MNEQAVVTAPAPAFAVERGTRDVAVDIVKAASLVIAVIMHIQMAGVSWDSDGGVIVTNALAGHPIFAWATWGLQVMPLFFALGGFSSYIQWRRMRSRGSSAADYLRLRANRLARPAIVPIALVGLTLAIFSNLGFPSAVISQAGFMMGQPLWFLAVYLLCNAFIPVMTTLHERAPLRVLAALLAAALLVDTVTVTFHPVGIPALNFLFVWLFLQQLGFFVADGRLARTSWRTLLAGVIASYALLFVLTSYVGYSRDMYDNLNPATSCIVVLGVGQVLLVALLRPVVNRHTGARVVRLASTINTNSLIIYLWHVPLTVLVALVMLALRLPMPDPLSGLWWLTRAPFTTVVLGLVVVVVAVVVRWRRRFPAWIPTRTPLGLSLAKTLLATAGVTGILLAGYSPWWHWALSLALIVGGAALEPWWQRIPRNLPVPGRP